MKTKDRKNEPGFVRYIDEKLKQLREWEKLVGVYICEPPRQLHRNTECLVIYDENGVRAGEVQSKGKYFTSVDELREAILALDVWEAQETPRRRAGTGSIGSG